MVNDEGQLYTIEGIAAAVIMLVTAYIMLNTTTLFTPADTHVTDMQLEQLGNDVLAMMDVADTVTLAPPTADQSYIGYFSPLEESILYSDTTNFNETFKKYANTLYGNPTVIDIRPLHWNSTIYFRRADDSVGNYQFAYSGNNMTGREHFVTVTRWVHVNKSPFNYNIPGLSDPNIVIPSGITGVRDEDQVVLLEVLLWRD